MRGDVADGKRMNRRHRTFISSIGALALCLAGCSSGGSDASSDGGVPTRAQNGSELCDAVARVLLPAADLEDAPEPRSDEEELEAIETVAAAAPDELQGRWDEAIAAIERSMAEPGAVSPEEGDAVVATFEDSFGWAREACGDLPPSWACVSHSEFKTVGEPITEDDAPPPPTSPEEYLAQREGERPSDEAVELDQLDGQILYGFLDSDGAVIDSFTIAEQDDGTWALAASSSCNDDVSGSGSSGFEDVGEPIEGPGGG